MDFNSDECPSPDEDKDYMGSDEDDSEGEVIDDPPAPDSETDEAKAGEKFKDRSGKEDLTVTGGDTNEIVVVPCGIGASAEPKDKDIPLDNNSMTEKEPKGFLELCKELTRDPDLKKHVAEFKDHLKNGSEAFLAGHYRKAAECYKTAKERVGRKLSDYEIDDRQFNVIKYALCAALINHNTYDDVVKAIQGLTEMEIYRLSIPALYILMARAYCKLNRFKSALEPLEKLQEIVDNFLIFPAFSWPETTETIQETTPAGLKNAIKELNQLCRMQHKPTATCRFDNCLKISSHIVPSELIYLSDPDFIGYVKMICEGKCHIEFHISCWKAYKESVCGIGKINDKDFIGRHCLTTDCVNSNGEPSQITTIEIIGSDGQVKSVNKHDPKTSAEPKKTKKKKSRIDDKEKLPKPKKSKEKKAAREVKKPVAVGMEEEDESAEALHSCADPVKALESRKQALVELRALKFGLEEDYWNPQLKYYGRPDESVKSVLGQFLDPREKKESDPDTDAKEFLFSYFLSILKDEGPLRQADVEDIWKQSAGDFCDIKVVLPDLKNISEVLGESTSFCLIEDYICLAEQVDEAYKLVKTEVVETATFLLTGNAESREEAQEEILEEPHSSHSHPPDCPPSDSDLLHSSSDDESEDGEEISVCDSEESDELMTEDEDHILEVEDELIEEHTQISPEPTIVPPKPLEDERFSLEEMLNEMTRVKSMFMKATDDGEFTAKKDESDNSDEKVRDKEETSSTETFESANSSHSMNVTASEDLKNCGIREINLDEIEESEFAMGSESSNDDKVSEETVIANILEQPGTSTDVNPELLEFPENVRQSIIALKRAIDGEDTATAGDQNSVDNFNNDKGSQSEIKTEERQIQTSPMVTTHKPSQTKESELFKDLNKKLHDFQNQIVGLKKEIQKVNLELAQKEACVKKIKSTHEAAVTRLKDEYRSNLETQQALSEKLKAQAAEKESELKKECDELLKSKEKVRELYTGLLVKYNQMKKDLASQQKSASEMKELLTTANANIKQLQTGNKTLEKNIKTKVAKAQQLHLQSIKVYWEREINQLRKRCVEKISEMQSWFSMFPPEEVEDLPSWATIRQTTMQWGEVSKKVQEIETDFQIKYNAMELKLNRGEELDELNIITLPKLPEEPKPLPLDKIHKEITEKHLKRISDLTQLVASQQLEIEKSKETNHQVQQFMNTFQMVPRMQTPMTTAFGSLALQYPYPQSTPPSFGQTATVPNIPPNQDTAVAGGAAKILQADVQTLLKESSKAVSFTSAIAGKSAVPEDVSLIGNLSLTMPPEATPKAQTPPPVGVAQNLLKASTNLAEKKATKSEERSRTPKPELSASSRESTPAPSAAPTPDKPKKKKKKKSESKDFAEVKVVFPVTHEPASVTNYVSNEDQNEWNVVLPKNAWLSKAPISTTAPPPDTKLKNKKKLLDKLLIKFPTTNLKEMDEIVKQLREENNGSLSGLSFDEIEIRVGRIITKRQYLKSTTLGLVKFSDVAWVTVNQDEMISWTNLQNDDCSICLESMGQERTKVNCNHEFHTKCLRKWLKEKSVCPLCNKFTTMPDEFPAL